MFLPHKDFAESASVLDRARLGKQRVETFQIIKALLDPTYGWQNHPAKKMFEGHIGALVAYQEAVCHEWVNVRGYKDTCLQKTYDLVKDLDYSTDMPEWLGREDFHLSHQSNLVQKDPIFYGPIFPNAPENMAYVWPVNNE